VQGQDKGAGSCYKTATGIRQGSGEDIQMNEQDQKELDQWLTELAMSVSRCGTKQ